EIVTALERRAGNADEPVDRHALGMRIESRERMQHRDPIAAALAEPEDAAAADLQPRAAHAAQRLEPVRERPGRDDLRVERLGRVEVVVVIVEPGLGEALRLTFAQQAERRARLEPERLDLPDHL